jgi:hypothetical protein
MHENRFIFRDNFLIKMVFKYRDGRSIYKCPTYMYILITIGFWKTGMRIVANIMFFQGHAKYTYARDTYL